ncbi:uncharacterized protein LOC119673441 [Teleopsis dalmanni]|uniref:uncharacterized protein LOC119673441 n=1 Tax=Teleopsis dalmanni TaxID=139649 RepID=UPI0018CFBF0C|nr:uncharacterized protein LOC119673441 [Teleopsis dalmanni]
MGYLKYFASVLSDIMPYLIYLFVIFTFFPKSLHKIKIFAKNNYDSNRYHRCYSPNECCHVTKDISKKVKIRRAVTRNERKQNSNTNISKYFQNIYEAQPKDTHAIEVNKMTEEFGTTNDGIDVYTKRESLAQKQMCLHSKIDDTIALHDVENLKKNSVTQVNSDWNIYDEMISQSLLQTSYKNKISSEASTVEISSKISASTNSSPFFQNRRLNVQPSLEDVIVTITRNVDKNENTVNSSCNYLMPVNSIDDILSQRRLSRPLSAYSISDLLLNEENSRFVMDDAHIDNFLHALNGS